SVAATLVDTILLTDAVGQPLTGLDPDRVRPAANGFPDLPQASNGRVSIDSESLALLPDGSFFIGDEYGPYVYRFSPAGRMLAAIRPPEAFVPKRNGKDQFASNNPGPGAQAPEPPNPETGRQNNQGFEGLTLAPPRGRFLVVAVQSATRQDGGSAAETRRYTRLLYYDVADPDRPKLVREHIVPLPVFETAQGERRVAAQSELLALDETFFLLLCRDAGNGYGTDGATSRYRSIDLLDAARATNLAGSRYDGIVPVAPDRKLVDAVVPATLTPYIDINNTEELKKFGLHNGEPNDRNNLSEKWEGMALVPALDPENPNDYFFVRHQRQRVRHAKRLSGRRRLQGRERARSRHHDPGLPRHVAGEAEIDFRAREQQNMELHWRRSRTGRAARPLILPHWPLVVFLIGNNPNIFSAEAVIAFAERPPAQGSSYSGTVPASADCPAGRWPSPHLGAKWRRSEGESGIAFGRAAWRAGRRGLCSRRNILGPTKPARGFGPLDRSGASLPRPLSPASS